MAGLQFPAPGCIVEYFESNTPQIGMVTEEARGRLRLLLPNGCENQAAVLQDTALTAPWCRAFPPCPGTDRESA